MKPWEWQLLDLKTMRKTKERVKSRLRSGVCRHGPHDPVLIIHTFKWLGCDGTEILSPRSISHNIWLPQTEAVLLPLTTMIMIRLKALTGETWTNAR